MKLIQQEDLLKRFFPIQSLTNNTEYSKPKDALMSNGFSRN